MISTLISCTDFELTLLSPIEFSIKLNTIKSGWSNIEGLQIIISKNISLSLKINFVLANGADPDEMPHCVAFHLGLHCLPKYPFRGFQP